MLLVSVKKEQFELLCKDGSRKPVDEYSTCNWGTVPSRAIITSSAISFKIRRMYQRFLEKAARIFHKNRNNTTVSNRFDNNQKNYENRTSFNNRFDEDDFNRNGINNLNEYSTDNWTRNEFGRSFNGGNGFNSWEKPVINDTFDYSRDHTELTNVQPIEVFDLYESAPRYGMQHNLIFSVSHVFIRLYIYKQETLIS